MKLHFPIFMIICLIILYGICFVGTLPDPFSDDSLEIARRLQCEVNQLHIYKAIEEYYNSFDRLPHELRTLYEEGYLVERDLYCPNKPRRLFLQKPSPKVKYEYYPENFGDPNLPLISEPITNHWGEGIRLKRLTPVVNQIMGDGTRNRKTIQINKNKEK